MQFTYQIDPRVGQWLNLVAFILAGLAMASWWQDFLSAKQAAAGVGVMNLTVSAINYVLHGMPPINNAVKAIIAFFAILLLSLILGGSPARAQIAAKAPPVSNVYPTKACGLFYGVNAEGGSGVVNGAPAGTVVIGGAVGGLIGYACPTAGIPWFVEADFDFQNLNAGNAGFSLSGPAHLTQLIGVQTPLLSWFSTLINIGQANIPAITPLLPPGVSVNGTPQNYVAFTSTEDDVSAQFGAASARDWIWSPGARTGLLFNLSGPNGTQAVGDVYAGIEFQSNALCLGAFACPKLGQRFVTGFSLKM